MNRWINVHDRLPDDLPDADVVQTNADRIRSMSDEECAEWLSNHMVSVCVIVCGGVCNAINSLEKSADQICKEKILNWLKQPCEED